MLFVDRAKLAEAAEGLMIAARTVVDQNGRKVSPSLPRLPAGVALPLRPGTGSSDVNPIMDTAEDYPRIAATALAAIVSLIGHPIAGYSDERPSAESERGFS